ncbi:MAG TPA: hypothetical protein VFQ95_00320 [Rhodanobacteraceae bacterium]|nr:hypothetical protein [Rhodanobacteraceae bacterium]
MPDPYTPSPEPTSTATGDGPHTTAVGVEAWLSGTYASTTTAPHAADMSVVETTMVAPTIDEPTPALEIDPVNAAEALALEAFANPRKLAGADGAELIVDPVLKTYYAESTSLKPLGTLLLQPADRWVPIYTEALNATRAAYPAQPLERLRWYAGLVATPGILARRLRRDQRYKLRQWPETEREFPRHFRIARAMMKDAADIDQIARAAGVTHAEAIDYVNACHAAARLDVVDPTASAPTPSNSHPSRKGRLMARFDPRRLAR